MSNASDAKFSKKEELNIQHEKIKLFASANPESLKENSQSLTVDDVIAISSKFDQQIANGKFDFDTSDEGKSSSNSEYNPLLKEFLDQIKNCLMLRLKYQRLSNQLDYQDPKNKPNWKSYPKLLPRFWHYTDEFKNYESENSTIKKNEYNEYTGNLFSVDEFLEEFDVPPFDSGCTFNKDLAETEGVYQLSIDNEFDTPPGYVEFIDDLQTIIDNTVNSSGLWYAQKRLGYLSEKYDYYSLINSNTEVKCSKLISHRDFYNVRKINNNINIDSSMNQKQLLNFIRLKLSTEPDKIVKYDNESRTYLSLKDMLKSWGDNARDLSIDEILFSINNCKDKKLDQDYKNIQEVFLDYDNFIQGQYLAQIIKLNIVNLEMSKYQYCEYNIELKLQAENPWEILSNWVIREKLFSQNFRLIIKIDFCYENLKGFNNFGEVLTKIFHPLFEVSADPYKNLNLFIMLTKINAFDLYNDFKVPENLSPHDNTPTPFEWNIQKYNPPSHYYYYYFYMNTLKLNNMRTYKNINVIKIRSHAGSIFERSGKGLVTKNLSLSYLFSSMMINGAQLASHPVLQYIFYLSQIGIINSPSSDNYKLSYLENPIYEYFKVGMKTSLNCSNPLFSSFTHEALIEEYSIAASILKLSNVEMCEFCRNSVENSGFEGNLKRHWIGIEYINIDNDIKHLIDNHKKLPARPISDQIFVDEDYGLKRSKVPEMRLLYRKTTLDNEFNLLNSILSSK